LVQSRAGKCTLLLLLLLLPLQMKNAIAYRKNRQTKQKRITRPIVSLPLVSHRIAS